MRTETFVCDLCGEPATEWWRIQRHQLVDGLRHGAHDMVELDLCPKCAQAMAERIGDGRDEGLWTQSW